MNFIPLEQLGQGGLNPPINNIPKVDMPHFGDNLGAARFRYSYPEGRHLDSLLVNKDSDTLVVALHGALHREKYQLPRFEWLTTLLSYSVNSMYFTDPTLWMEDKIQLAWYTGWPGADVQQHIATWIIQAAKRSRG